MNTSFLDTICTNPELETRWLDVLSQLEYVGCRKILKSLAYGRVEAAMMRHVSEEALHSFLLKDLVEKRQGVWTSWTDNPWSKAGWQYIQGVDQALSVRVPPDKAYALVSWAIEERVLALYPAYLKRTDCPDVRRAVKAILAQEKRHSVVFDQFDEETQQSARSIEAVYWESFQSQIEASFPESNVVFLKGAHQVYSSPQSS